MRLEDLIGAYPGMPEGDTLFRFLQNELCDPNDELSQQTARHRLVRAIADLALTGSELFDTSEETLMRDALTLHCHVQPKMDAIATQLVKALYDTLDYLDEVCDPQSDIKTDGGVAVYMRVLGALEVARKVGVTPFGDKGGANA